MESEYIALMVYHLYGKAIDKQEKAATEYINTTQKYKHGTTRKWSFFKVIKN